MKAGYAMKKIKNENDFLKYFSKNANDHGEVEILKVFNDKIISREDLTDFIRVTSSKGYIKYIDYGHYRITPYGRSAYIPFWKHLFRSLFSGFKITVREVISFLLGILSAIIIQIILKWLGIN